MVGVRPRNLGDRVSLLKTRRPPMNWGSDLKIDLVMPGEYF
jgi:hypothetical protein